jgi:hypothetical protein
MQYSARHGANRRGGSLAFVTVKVLESRTHYVAIAGVAMSRIEQRTLRVGVRSSARFGVMVLRPPSSLEPEPRYSRLDERAMAR